MTGVLVLNSGSSSIKYQVFDMDDRSVLARGLLEQIGEERSRLTHRVSDGEPHVEDLRAADHAEALEEILHAFDHEGGMPRDLVGVGHRVVHGGDRFSGPARIDDDTVDAIRDLIPLAPLHNPANLAGIEVARSQFPDVAQVAVFDTAFHAALPPRAYRYALPADLAERLRLRRYGFHGTSHAFVARAAAEHLGRSLTELNLVTLHLGNGASVCAVAGGVSVDTSMGLTPLEGLVMGTRSGDLDPAAVLYLQREGGLSLDEIDDLLNKRSGLKGLTGVNDLRDIEQRAAGGDDTAAEALELYAYRIRKYVGAYAVALGGLDGLVFTAGVGENSPGVRARVCEGLGLLGVALDPRRNAERTGSPRTVSADHSRVPVLVVPTDEEAEIARQTLAVISEGDGRDAGA